jgi:hypothetical protein
LSIITSICRIKLVEPVTPTSVCPKGTEGPQIVENCSLGARHRAIVVFIICAEDNGEPALKTFICHNGTPYLKVSNRRSQYVDSSKERVNQMRDQIRFSKCRTASDQREQEI